MLKTRWETIRDDVAEMLADGKSLESIIGKLEEMKNEMAKAELIAVFDELKKPKPHTNEEWFCGLSTEEKAEFIVKIEMSAMHPVKRGAVDMEKFIEEVVDWLKQPHKEKHHDSVQE